MSISIVIAIVLVRKQRVMMKKVDVSHGMQKDKQDAEKERVTLHPSPNIVGYSSIQQWCYDGQKRKK
jgi:hypothetical protein